MSSSATSATSATSSTAAAATAAAASTTTAPTTTSSSTATTSGSKDVSIAAIEDLQVLERKLLKELQTSPSDNVNAIVEKINQTTRMRQNLYNALKDNYTSRAGAVDSAATSIMEQKKAVDVMEQQLGAAKKQFELLQSEKNNNVRLLQINTYFEDRTEASVVLMRLFVTTLVAIIAVVLVRRTGLLPNSVFYLLLVGVSVVGGYYFWRQFISMAYRNNMNYREFDWRFNPGDQPGDDFSHNPAAALTTSQLDQCPTTTSSSNPSTASTSTTNSGTTTSGFQAMSTESAASFGSALSSNLGSMPFAAIDDSTQFHSASLQQRMNRR